MSAQHTRPDIASRCSQDQRGFSLIELLIVVAIILIIAAIAIPSFLHARMAANEASAVEHVRAIVSAGTIYSTTWNNGYPPTLDVMGGVGTTASCDGALLLDQLITNPPYLKSGYTFGYTSVGPKVPTGAGCGNAGTYSYLVTAKPSTWNVTGQRSFCSDTPGVIHYDLTGAPAASIGACEALPTL